MAPNRLMCKTASGEVVPFEVDGEHWVDGSFEADVPFKQMSSLFSVSNFIVSQVNFHVIPFLQHKLPEVSGNADSHSPHGMAGHSTFKVLISTLDLDLKHRVLTLAKMGLLPKLYGQDISKMFRQSYRGDVTIVPELKIAESVGIKAIMNPTVQDMQVYIRDGRRACWPHLSRIRHLLSIEAYIWGLLKLVRSQQQPYYILPSDNILLNDLEYNHEPDIFDTPSSSSKSYRRCSRRLVSGSRSQTPESDSISLSNNKRTLLSKEQFSTRKLIVEDDDLTDVMIHQRIFEIETELSAYRKLLEQKVVTNRRTRSGTMYSR